MSSRTFGLASAALALIVPTYLSAVGEPESAAAAPLVRNLSELKLAAFPGAATCLKGAVVNGDPSKGASTFILKGTRGCRAPWHWHSSTEEVMLTAGVARLEMKDATPSTLHAGGYGMLPSHHVHQFTCMTPCTVFVRSDGIFDIHYVNAAGTEISAAEALGPEAPKKQ